LIAGKTKRRTRRQIEFAIVRRHEVQRIGPPMIAKAVTMSRAFVLRSARAKIIASALLTLVHLIVKFFEPWSRRGMMRAAHDRGPMKQTLRFSKI